MPTVELGQLQNDITTLPKLNSYNYENIFRVYQDSINGPYYYNILNAVTLPAALDPKVYYNYEVPNSFMPWTSISFKVYGTIKLWWIICLANGIIDPTSFPAGGVILRMIYPEYVREILSTIKQAQ